MWSIFFDQHNNFQWGSIAAIVSFLALCSTTVSIFVTKHQSKMNRKSTTLVSLRIEELKDVRKETSAIITTIWSLSTVSDKYSYDVVIQKYIQHQNVLYSILYRENQHTELFLEKIYLRDSEIYKLNDKFDIGDWIQEFEEAAKQYSKTEYEKIKKYI